MRKVALSANLAWICWILARFAMKGGQVQEPKLMTSGVVREGAVLRRGTRAPVVQHRVRGRPAQHRSLYIIQQH